MLLRLVVAVLTQNGRRLLAGGLVWRRAITHRLSPALCFDPALRAKAAPHLAGVRAVSTCDAVAGLALLWFFIHHLAILSSKPALPFHSLPSQAVPHLPSSPSLSKPCHAMPARPLRTAPCPASPGHACQTLPLHPVPDQAVPRLPCHAPHFRAYPGLPRYTRMNRPHPRALDRSGRPSQIPTPHPA